MLYYIHAQFHKFLTVQKSFFHHYITFLLTTIFQNWIVYLLVISGNITSHLKLFH